MLKLELNAHNETNFVLLIHSNLLTNFTIFKEQIIMKMNLAYNSIVYLLGSLRIQQLQSWNSMKTVEWVKSDLETEGATYYNFLLRKNNWKCNLKREQL